MRLPALKRRIISLRSWLFALFTLVILLALIPAFLIERTEEKATAALERIVNTDMRVSELALASVAAFGRARRHEKDFLLYHAEFGFKEARARYAVRVESSIADLKHNLDQVSVLVTDAKSRAQAAEIKRAADEYLASFKAMVDLREALAYPHRGLAARMEQAVTELAPALPPGEAVLAALIEVHRAARELATDPGEAEYGQLMEALDELQQIGPVTRLLSGSQQRLASILIRCRERAAQLRDLGQQIAERRTTYLKAAQTVEPELDRLHLARSRAAQETLSLTRKSNLEAQRISIAAVMLVVILALALAAWVATRLRRNMTAFVALTREIADGRFDAAPPETGIAEFAQLRDAVSAMSEKLRGHQAEVARQAGLDRLLESLGAVASQAQTVAEAMRECLRLICEFTGWSIGHAALTERREGYAVATTDFWHTGDAERFREFIETSSNYHYSLTQGTLICGVFATKQPTWAREFDPAQTRRGDVRRRAGLASGIALRWWCTARCSDFSSSSPTCRQIRIRSCSRRLPVRAGISDGWLSAPRSRSG